MEEVAPCKNKSVTHRQNLCNHRYMYLHVHYTYIMYLHVPPQLARLGIQVSLAIHVYMFVCLGYGWVGYFTFLFFLLVYQAYMNYLPFNAKHLWIRLSQLSCLGS